MRSRFLMFARKPLTSPAKHNPARRFRRHLFAQLRDNVTTVRAIKRDYLTIAKRITLKDALALSPNDYTPTSVPRLARHAIKALLDGSYADVGGRSILTRVKNLIRAATTYPYQELPEKPCIGVAKLTEIKLWLEERGASLRPSQ